VPCDRAGASSNCRDKIDRYIHSVTAVQVLRLAVRVAMAKTSVVGLDGATTVVLKAFVAGIVI
jgi:hypothetical protein